MRIDFLDLFCKLDHRLLHPFLPLLAVKLLPHSQWLSCYGIVNAALKA
jgi:hypothetical protein